MFDTVVEGIGQGVVNDVDPLIAAFAFWCSAHGVVSLIIAKPRIGWPDDESLIELTLDLTIDGIRRGPPRTSRSAKTAGQGIGQVAR